MNPEYESRLAARTKRREQRQLEEDRIANLRMGLFLLGVLASLFFWSLRVYWIPALGLGFVGLVISHLRVKRLLARDQAAERFYQHGLDRLSDRWKQQPASYDAHLSAHHPFAMDLDIFGPGSLFERISECNTHTGEKLLASWLSSKSTADEAIRRQEMVHALKGELDWREELFLLSPELERSARSSHLLEWVGGVRTSVPSLGVRGILLGMTLVNVALVGLSFAGVVPSLVVWLGLGVQGLVAFGQRGRTRAVFESLDFGTRDLDVLIETLRLIEKQRWTQPQLQTVQSQVATARGELVLLRFWLELADSRRNQFFALFALLLMWSTHLALALDAWRARHAGDVEAWLLAIGEIEAVTSLAGFAYENPQYTYPKFTSRVGIRAQQLGHPLLTAAQRVCNDVALGDSTQMYLVSGSNMSGKSTFLRAIGINTVLAMAGAPVCAQAMELCPFEIGATLKVQDSLQSGESRFYAEIVRLKNVMELTRGSVPVLFLLDEILHGTNSHDRLTGAKALVVALLKLNTVGLVTTHDLALTEIGSELGRVSNVYFADHFEQGRMVFDYQMREGVIDKSNALELMRSVGLPV